MRIANPIYDAVFKYLLEDIEIAKGLISRIIGEEIVELTFQPEELKTKSEKYLIVILRIDFKAIIKTQDGSFKKILIEIQKGKVDDDVVRFRNYLSENYKGKEVIKLDNGITIEEALPIVSIYFLGFPLKNISSPAIKVGRNYIDLIDDKVINEKNDFIERLTHDGYFIQIGKLEKLDETEQSDLERILDIFNQSYRLIENKRLLEISEEEISTDPLLKKMIDRLFRAAANEQLQRELEIVDEVEEKIEKQIRKVHLLESQIQETKSALDETKSTLDETKSTLDETKSTLDETKNQLNSTENSLKETEKILAEKEFTATKQLIEFTELSNKQIAEMRKVSVKYVEDIRQSL